MFVVNAGWGEEGEGEKFLSSFAKQRNIAQRFSVANNNKNFTDITQLLLQFLFYVDILFFFFFSKSVKNLYGGYKGNEHKARLWQFECHVDCCIPRVLLST